MDNVGTINSSRLGAVSRKTVSGSSFVFCTGFVLLGLFLLLLDCFLPFPPSGAPFICKLAGVEAIRATDLHCFVVSACVCRKNVWLCRGTNELTAMNAIALFASLQQWYGGGDDDVGD